MSEVKIKKERLEEAARKVVKEILTEALVEEDMFKKFELSTAGRVIRIEEKLDKFVTKEEFQKAINDINKRIDERTAETNRKIVETNKRIDETNKRIDETNKRIDERTAEINKRIDETNKRIDERTAETNRRVDETNRRIDETNRRIDKLMWLLIGAISGIVGTLITAILNLLK